jgi:hypothetical protein
VHDADPSRGASLRHDVPRCGLSVRSIRVAGLFAKAAREKASRCDYARCWELRID